MIKTVIKRDGREESFDMFKLSHLAEWASEKPKVDWDAGFYVLENRLDKALNIKQAMMQELLTGKTRMIQGWLNG